MGKAGEKFCGLLQGLCFHDTLLCLWESFYHFPGPSLPRMKGAGRRKQELVGRREDQEIGAVIILIPFYSTSIPVPKAFCQWRAWFYFKMVNLTSWKKASHCNSIIFYCQQHKRNSILNLRSKKKVEPIYDKARGERGGCCHQIPIFHTVLFL